MKNDAYMFTVSNFQETRVLIQMYFKPCISSQTGKTADFVDTVALLRTCVVNFRLCGVDHELKKKKKKKQKVPFTRGRTFVLPTIYKRVL